MNSNLHSILSKIAAVSCAVMMVATLSVIAVKRAEHRPAQTVAAGSSKGGSDGFTAGSNGGDTTGTTVAGGQQATAGSGPAGSGPTAGSPAAGTPQAGGGGGSAAAKPGAAAGPASGPAATPAAGGCTDANPDQGVFCDHWTVGGTTVLSGPLAVYGEGGLRGGQAWLTYFNKVLAPQEGSRQIKLVYYDDSDDPNK